MPRTSAVVYALLHLCVLLSAQKRIMTGAPSQGFVRVKWANIKSQSWVSGTEKILVNGGSSC